MAKSTVVWSYDNVSEAETDPPALLYAVFSSYHTPFSSITS